MDNLNEVLSKKAFEVNYAVFRVSSVLKNAKFSQCIEGYALDLLSNILARNYVLAREEINGLIYFLRLGGEVSLINHNTVQILIHEIEILDSAIAEYDDRVVLPDLDLGEIFSGASFVSRDTANQKVSVPKTFDGDRAVTESGRVLEKEIITPASSEYHDVENMSSLSPSVVSEYNSATMRQSAILDKIRQSGYCRLKDVQDIIPNSSERTLRYDLQKLIDQGRIERIGSGGPASFYRLKREEGGE